MIKTTVVAATVFGMMFGAIGCTTTPVVKPTPAPRTQQWGGTVALRLVRITNGGQSPWSDAKIESYTRWLDPAYSKANLKFDILPLEVLEKPEWYTVDNILEVGAMLAESKTRSAQRGELTIWLCDSLPINGAGGFANYPSNRLVSIYQHGIFLSRASFDMALTHEIGHAFNLRHAWSDNFTDTPTENKDDCVNDPCNMMNYCGNRRRPIDDCLAHNLSDQQIAEVRKWSQYSPRNQVVKVVNPLLGARPIYTDNTELVID